MPRKRISMGKTIEESFSKADKAKIQQALKDNKNGSIANAVKLIKAAGFKDVSFNTESPFPPHILIRQRGKAFVVVNAKSADKPDFVENGLAGGLMEDLQITEAKKRGNTADDELDLVGDDENNETPENKSAQRKFLKLHQFDKRRFPIPGTKHQFKGNIAKTKLQPNNKDPMYRVNPALKDHIAKPAIDIVHKGTKDPMKRVSMSKTFREYIENRQEAEKDYVERMYEENKRKVNSIVSELFVDGLKFDELTLGEKYLAIGYIRHK